jgi:predicted metal-dependent phosphoesterase TrpH
MSPDAVVEAAIDAGLDGIAITDHDTCVNVKTVRKRAPSELKIISGVEVTTTQGHLLAIGVQTPPKRSDPLSVIDDVHEQGGVAVLSHPFDRLRQRYASDLDRIAAAVDGVEVVNSRCIAKRFNERALSFATEHRLGRTGGSDAHFPIEVGRAVTIAQGPLLEAIASGETNVEGRGRYLSGHALTKLHELREFVR